MVFFDTMYEVMELSRKACAFMMRSMLADHPYSEVVNTQGESAMRELTNTFSTLSPNLLHQFAQRLELRLHLLEFLLLVLVIDLQTLLGGALEFLAIELLELLDSILINGVSHVDHLVALLTEGLQERRR